MPIAETSMIASENRAGSKEASAWVQARTWGLLFLVAAMVQIGFLALLPASARSNDSVDFLRYYDPVAQNLLAGNGLVVEPGKFGTTYPPGFPVFLAFAYRAGDLFHISHIHALLALNVLAMSLAAVLVFATAKALFDTEIALCSTALWITYLFNLWLIKQPNSEVPFTPLLYGGIYFLIRSWQKRTAGSAVACGFLLGLAALVRPIVIFLPVLAAVLLLTRKEIAPRKRTLIAVLIVVVFGITVLPWEAALYIHTGRVAPLSTNGPATIFDGVTFTRRSNVQGIPPSVADLMRRIAANQRELNSSAKLFGYLAAEAKHHPGTVADLFLLKAARSWFGTDSGAHERPILALQGFYLAFAMYGFFLLYERRPDRRPQLALLLILVLYFWGMAFVALSILRYLVPAMAYLLIPAAALPATLIKRRRQMAASGAV